MRHTQGIHQTVLTDLLTVKEVKHHVSTISSKPGVSNNDYFNFDEKYVTYYMWYASENMCFGEKLQPKYSFQTVKITVLCLQQKQKIFHRRHYWRYQGCCLGWVSQLNATSKSFRFGKVLYIDSNSKITSIWKLLYAAETLFESVQGRRNHIL